MLEVHHSPARLFLFGVVGLALMVAALDVMWLHRVSTPPERVNDVLTTKGSNQRRADYLWGMPMLLGGAGLFGYALLSLLRREPLLVVRDDGMEFQLGAPGAEPTFVPWDVITDVYSAAEPDPDDGPPAGVVVFVFTDSRLLPAEPWDAEWDGLSLKVNTSGWELRPEDVVVHARVAMEASRRDRRLPGGDDG